MSTTDLPRMIAAEERAIAATVARLRRLLDDVSSRADADVPVGAIAAAAGEVEAARARLATLRRLA